MKTTFDKMFIIEPHGKSLGHSSIFARVLYKYYKNFVPDVFIITFDGIISRNKETINIIEVSKYLPKFLSNFINYIYSKKIFLSGSIKTMIVLLYAFRFKNKDTLLYFADGTLICLLLFSFLSNHKNTVAYIHTFNQIKFLFEINFRRRIIFSTILNKIISKIDCYFLIPKSIKNRNKFLKSPRFIETDWGIEDDSQKLSKKTAIQNKNYYLLFGSNHHSKNYEIVIKNFIDSKRKYNLLIAGKLDTETIRIAQTIKKIKILNKFIPDKNIPSIFSNARAVILSYRKEFNATCSIFNFAMKYRIPVIASESTGLKYTIINNNLGLVFKSDSSEDLRNKLNLFDGYFKSDIEKLKANIDNYFRMIIDQKGWKKIIENEFNSIKRKLMDFN